MQISSHAPEGSFDSCGRPYPQQRRHRLRFLRPSSGGQRSNLRCKSPCRAPKWRYGDDVLSQRPKKNMGCTMQGYIYIYVNIYICINVYVYIHKIHTKLRLYNMLGITCFTAPTQCFQVFYMCTFQRCCARFRDAVHVSEILRTCQRCCARVRDVVHVSQQLCTFHGSCAPVTEVVHVSQAP